MTNTKYVQVPRVLTQEMDEAMDRAMKLGSNQNLWDAALAAAPQQAQAGEVITPDWPVCNPDCDNFGRHKTCSCEAARESVARQEAAQRAAIQPQALKAGEAKWQELTALFALQVIIDYPISDHKNMDAANIKLIALNAMYADPPPLQPQPQAVDERTEEQKAWDRFKEIYGQDVQRHPNADWRGFRRGWQARASLSAQPTPVAAEQPVKIDIQRIEGSLASGTIQVPQGMSREEKRAFIINAAHPVAGQSRDDEPTCVCAEPEAPNTVHRTDGPCYQAEQQADAGGEPVAVAQVGKGPVASFCRLTDVGRALPNGKYDLFLRPPAPAQFDYCPNCRGTGETTQLSDNGPDAHEVSIVCPHCNGNQTLESAYRGVCELLNAEHKKYIDACGKLYFSPPAPAQQGLSDAISINLQIIHDTLHKVRAMVSDRDEAWIDIGKAMVTCRTIESALQSAQSDALTLLRQARGELSHYQDCPQDHIPPTGECACLAGGLMAQIDKFLSQSPQEGKQGC